MNKKIAFILWIVVCAAVSEAGVLGRAGITFRCQCIQTSSHFIHPVHFADIQMIPAGPHCINLEMIVQLKSGQKVCLNPGANWVKRIIKRILNRQKD
ncbi:interleukin-8-like [Acipenser oxyrinchus oxyrinchus]|uniref:Interleukin-8-like n=1 Tax=Acipenser oxyrinchus oxyrinchus TaxID=40147 RepID=A0AAD8LUI5_ACIOX|nr:interleukin-8-like [Acipenser oxyrinchus oxyrinchus]